MVAVLPSRKFLWTREVKSRSNLVTKDPFLSGCVDLGLYSVERMSPAWIKSYGAFQLPQYAFPFPTSNA